MTALSTSRPRRMRLLFSALAAVALAAGSAVAAPAPAEATTSPTCPSGYLCMWYNSGFTGARADLYFSDAALSNEVFNDGPRGARGWGETVGNDAASLWNRTGERIRVYDRQYCSASSSLMVMSIAPGSKVDLGPINWKNRISSIYLEGRGQCVPYSQAHL